MVGTMGDGWMKCDLCNLDFHKNDYHNHISGRIHKGKARAQKMESATVSELDDKQEYFCEVCKRKLSNKLFYDIHIGSKTHKRKVRKFKSLNSGLQMADYDYNPSNILQSSLSNVDTMTDKTSKKVGRSLAVKHFPYGKYENFESLEASGPKQIRKKYKTRRITTDDEYYNELRRYVNNIVTYLSLKLALDSNVQEFQISVNDKTWNSFGDIVINLTYKDKNTIYAIKCKQVSNFDKQVQNLNEAKIIMEKEYRSISELKVSNVPIKFAIFIPCTATSSFATPVSVSREVLDRFSNIPDKEKTAGTVDLSVMTFKKRNEIINTNSDCENIITFFLDDASIHLPNVYVYTKQMGHLGMIYDLINKKIATMQSNLYDYSQYIANWSDGKLGGFYKLGKHEVILKLGEILLGPYVTTPKQIKLKHDSFAIWNEVMSHVDLTVVAWEQMIISKVSQPINKLIEDAFGVKIDTGSRSINLKNRINEYTDEELKAYLFEEVDNIDEDIPISQIYKVFWKIGKIPILLSTEKDESVLNFILEVISLMKQYGVHKKYLLKTKNPVRLKTKNNMVVFRCLHDIQPFVNLEEISLRISEDYKLSLATIAASDMFVLRWITPNIFFDLSLGKYTLKQNTFSKRDFEVESKIVLNEEIIREVQERIYGEDKTKIAVLDRLHGVDPRLF